MTILGISTDTEPYSDTTVPTLRLMNLTSIGEFSDGQIVSRVGFFLRESTIISDVINFSIYNITGTDYENSASGQPGPAGATLAWKGSFIVPEGAEPGWISFDVEHSNSSLVGVSDGDVIAYVASARTAGALPSRLTPATSGSGMTVVGEAFPEVWIHNSGVVAALWAFVELEHITTPGLREAVPSSTDSISSEYSIEKAPLVVGNYPWNPKFEQQGTAIRHALTLGNWLNVVSQKAVFKNHKVKGFGIQVATTSAPETELVVALYKLTDLSGAFPYKPIKVWEEKVVLPHRISRESWLYYSIDSDLLSGVEDGDVLAIGFSSAVNGYAYSVGVSVDSGSLSSIGPNTGLIMAQEFVQETSVNAVINSYIEMEEVSGLFEMVPAATDSSSATVQNPEFGNSFGISYRFTADYVVDPENVTYCLDGDTYPTTRMGITFGRLSSLDSGRPSRDRNATTDPRLAGMFQRSNATATPGLQRIDLPEGPGTYEFRMAAGDYMYAKAYNYVKVTDGLDGPALLTLIGNLGARQFMDATGAGFAHTAWPTENQPAILTFTSDHCIIQVGDGPLPEGTGDACVSHVFFTRMEMPSHDFEGDVSEFVPAATDSLSASFALDGNSFNISEAVPSSSDGVGAYFESPEFEVYLLESSPPSSDSVDSSFIKHTYSEIAEIVPAAKDFIECEFEAPIYSTNIAEVVPSSSDAIVSFISNAESVGIVFETTPSSSDLVYSEFSAGQVVGYLSEFVPAAHDSISLFNGKIKMSEWRTVSIPSSKRIIAIPKSGRSTIMPPAARIVSVASEERILKIGV